MPVFLTSVGRTYDLAALDTLRERRFAHLKKKAFAAKIPRKFLVKSDLTAILTCSSISFKRTQVNFFAILIKPGKSSWHGFKELNQLRAGD